MNKVDVSNELGDYIYTYNENNELINVIDKKNMQFIPEVEYNEHNKMTNTISQLTITKGESNMNKEIIITRTIGELFTGTYSGIYNENNKLIKCNIENFDLELTYNEDNEISSITQVDADIRYELNYNENKDIEKIIRYFEGKRGCYTIDREYDEQGRLVISRDTKFTLRNIYEGNCTTYELVGVGIRDLIKVFKEDDKIVKIEDIRGVMSYTSLNINATTLSYNDLGLLDTIVYAKNNIRKLVSFKYNEDNKIIEYTVLEKGKLEEGYRLGEGYTYNEQDRIAVIVKYNQIFSSTDTKEYDINNNLIKTTNLYTSNLVPEVNKKATTTITRYEGFTDDMKNINVQKDRTEIGTVYGTNHKIMYEISIDKIIEDILKNQ